MRRVLFRRGFKPMKKLLLTATAFAVALHLPAGASTPVWEQKHEIWFTTPAAQWKLGLPVGNGRLGAMVAGSFPKERIQLNEDSIWAKEPMLRHPPTNRDRIDEIQKLVEAGKYKEAHDLYESQIILSDAPGIGSYQTMGDLWIEHFGSAADDCLAVRLTATAETGLDINVGLTHPIAKFRGMPGNGDVLLLEGQAQYSNGNRGPRRHQTGPTNHR